MLEVSGNRHRFHELVAHDLFVLGMQRQVVLIVVLLGGLQELWADAMAVKR